MPAGSSHPFRPSGTAALSATVTSAGVMLAGGGDSVLITNATSALAFIRFGTDLTISASSADLPVLPNSRVLISVNSIIRSAAAVLMSGTGSLYFTRGEGSHL